MLADNSRPQLTDLEYHLLNDYQHGFPLCSRPFAQMARELGTDEETIIETLDRLAAKKMISRVGPVFKPRRIGASTLAALSVPSERLQAVADLVSSYEAVNHNYEREHEFNLWFVVTAADEGAIEQLLSEIRRKSNCQLINLPMEEAYHIDLGFPLWC
ncbi:MAG TPA: Lrp/AsnC family transcriptional regulator [Gammaproteobacteria bacterium]|nr:Lrp/AsnC family transcriptional regulator [Gammaproteobacteria bacterium]